MYGPRIKHFRKLCNLSQKELADMLHVSQSSITQWENETRTPDIETIIQLCSILGVTSDMLIGNELNENGTRLLISAEPFIEIAHELDSDSLEHWLSFGRWLASQNNNKATNQTSLPESDNESKISYISSSMKTPPF